MKPAKPKKTHKNSTAPIAIIMGSQSDWPTLKNTADKLDEFGVRYVKKIISAHRTPDRLFDFAKTAHEHHQIIIAGAGGAAHLPGMVASLTILPVLGVPMETKSLDGLDSLLSIAQMPGGVPVATLAIGKAGAINAALQAVAILSLHDRTLQKKWQQWRAKQTASIAKTPKDQE